MSGSAGSVSRRCVATGSGRVLAGPGRGRASRWAVICGGGGQDAAGDGLDGRGGPGARVGAGPAGDVREGDRPGVEAEVGGGQVGDGVGFDLADAGAGHGAGWFEPGGLGVQQDVAELVGERGDRLLGGQAGRDPDAAVAPGGEARRRRRSCARSTVKPSRRARCSSAVQAASARAGDGGGAAVRVSRSGRAAARSPSPGRCAVTR